MRFHGLLLSCVSVFLLCSPAKAGNLIFWKFESDRNQLVFTTDQGIQPTAQLLANPTRLAIDLPGTSLDRQTVKESYPGIVRSVRVGQFDAQTTRIVLELTPGYTMDPQQVRFQGTSASQWTVSLPVPTRESASSSRLPSLFADRQDNNRESSSVLSDNSRPVNTSGNLIDSQYLRVTRNGIFVTLDGSSSDRVKVTRSSDRSSIDFELDGVTLPNDLVSQTLAINNYGVSDIQFNQSQDDPAVATLTLKVDPDSPDWIASFSRFGGLVIVPKGGMASVETSTLSSSSTSSESRDLRSLPPTISIPQSDRYPAYNSRNSYTSSNTATINSILLDGTRLLIKGDREFIARDYLNRLTGVYEVRIANAKLSNSFTGPELETNSPISEMRVRQEGSTVLVLIEPASGVRIAGLNKLSNNLVSLDLQGNLVADTPSSNPNRDILIPPPNQTMSLPERQPLLPPRRSPVTWGNVSSKGKIVIVLDPGHGGKDAGAVGIGGLQEKNIILPISLEIGRILEQQGITVMQTRSSDYFVTLEGRTVMANQVNANLFVSIHANAISLSRPDVNGLETYYYKSGYGLANTVHHAILRSINIQDRGIKRARFYVLRHTKMPSILVEVGYVTGAVDASKLSNPDHRRQMAEAIARGIIEYVQQNKL